MSLESQKDSFKVLPALAHGSITKLFENIWFVKGTVKMPMLLPMKISRSMTIVKNPSNGEITLVNSMRLSDTGLAELERLGKVTHVIRIGGFHGRDDGFYRERYGAKIYAIKGQVYKRKLDKKKINAEDGYMRPDVWLNDNSKLPLDSASLKVFHSCEPAEAIIVLNRDGGILIAGDSLQNTAGPDEFVNLSARLMMKKMGFFKPYNVGPGRYSSHTPKKQRFVRFSTWNLNMFYPATETQLLEKQKASFARPSRGSLRDVIPNRRRQRTPIGKKGDRFIFCLRVG